jgi:hypothetical protein
LLPRSFTYALVFAPVCKMRKLTLRGVIARNQTGAFESLRKRFEVNALVPWKDVRLDELRHPSQAPVPVGKLHQADGKQPRLEWKCA